jgi:glycosyltransferase involved in cell wall biosynthesis
MSLTASPGPLARESHLAPVFQGGVPAEKVGAEVSIIMPCLNEAQSISACIAEATTALADSGLTGEVLVVDNGSNDGSAQVAAAAGARVIHEEARGYGNACRRGLAEARGRFLVLGDADGTYDFSTLPLFVAPLLNGADMVMGNRLNDSMQPGAMPWLHRHFGNPFLTWTLNRLFSSRIVDAHCGLRSIKAESLRTLHLSTPGMEFASEFLVEAMRQGVRIEQVDIRYRRRRGGRPKLRTIRDGLRHLRLLVTLWADGRRRHDDVSQQSVTPNFAGRAQLNRRGERDADRIRL